MDQANAGTIKQSHTIKLAPTKKRYLWNPSTRDGLDWVGCSAVESFLVGDDAGLE